MRKLMWIFNPQADHGRARSRIASLMAQTRASSHRWVATERPSHACDLAEEACRKGFDGVVAVGGDGTVHETINGLMRAEPPRRAMLGIVPVGSGNDFAAAVGIADPVHSVIPRMARGQTRAVDVCRVTDGQGRCEYWNNTCGIGLDAKISMRARKIKRLHGFAMYFAATMSTVFRDHRSVETRLWFDDLPAVQQRVLMLTLGNGPREGGGFHTTPESRIDDGRLEYALVGPLGRPTIFRLIPRVMRGTHGSSEYCSMGSFRRLRLEAAEPLTVHVDGEPFAEPSDNVRTLEIEIHPSAIQVVV